MCGATHLDQLGLRIIEKIKLGSVKMSLLNGIFVYLVLQALSLVALTYIMGFDRWM